MLLALVGDMMLGRGVAQQIAHRAPESFWGDTLSNGHLAAQWNDFCWLAVDPRSEGQPIAASPLRRS